MDNNQAVDDTEMPTNKQILSKLRDDGIYVDDPEVRQKFSDVNV